MLAGEKHEKKDVHRNRLNNHPAIAIAELFWRTRADPIPNRFYPHFVYFQHEQDKFSSRQV
ncbi:hypothetical protein B9037_015775 [Klebsiella aerogenes]|nr:hypothetical protein YA35_22845 [Klebsiella aerogenes]RNT27987.1 hypothetical protein B9037_015775 [Klebsiella aerogenes]